MTLRSNLIKVLSSLTLLVLAGCASHRANFDIPLVEYTKTQQKQAAEQLREARPKYPMLGRFVDDYGKLRRGIRAAK